ncbi:MAG TPA: hypothetical protein VNO70_16620 [Blastocatellia bacterium]|nr:hypothetical protein [Blastocatellia bacterium]
MSLPGYDYRGDLPEGVHQATMHEVLARFGGGTQQRRIITASLVRIFDLAKATGKLERFIIYGSYVTAKSEPNDVDIFLVMSEEFDVDNCAGETRDVFSHTQAQLRFGASVFWVNRATSYAHIDDLIAGWQTKRDKTRRGIVEIIL